MEVSDESLLVRIGKGLDPVRISCEIVKVFDAHVSKRALQPDDEVLGKYALRVRRVGEYIRKRRSGVTNILSSRHEVEHVRYPLVDRPPFLDLLALLLGGSHEFWVDGVDRSKIGFVID